MADNRHLEHRPAENRPVDLSDPAQRHEHADVNIWAVSKVGIGLILTTIASIFIVLGVFRFLQVQEHELPAASTGVDVDARRLPPEPRLIENEPENLQQVRAAENQILNGYSWADDKHTLVKIPIDRAIDLLAQRGLPSRPQNGPQSAAAGVTVPTESSLGPKMQQPGGPLATQLAGGQPSETQGK